MQNDLKRAQAKNEQLNTMILNIGANTAIMANRYRDRIAALEAKLAEKDALLRECGEALEGLATKLTEIFDHPEYEAVFLTAQIRRGPYEGPNCAEELATAIDTLARAKENSNVD